MLMFFQEERSLDTDIEKECHVKTETEVGVMHLKTKNAKNWSHHQKVGQRYGVNSLSEPPERTNPTDTYWTSSLQYSNSTNFCFIKQPSLWQFCHRNPNKLTHLFI